MTTITAAEYNNAIKNGKPAEMKCNFITRGGHIVGDRFYTIGRISVGHFWVPVNDTLKVH